MCNSVMLNINFLFVSSKKQAACLLSHYIFSSLSLSVPSIPPPAICSPSCGIMGIVQVAWRSTLCPRRSRRRRAVMTCSSARSPSSPSQLIPASRSSVTVGGESVGSLIRAPCNVSGSSSHPATSALPLLLPCLFYGCLPLCFPASQND